MAALLCVRNATLLLLALLVGLALVAEVAACPGRTRVARYAEAAHAAARAAAQPNLAPEAHQHAQAQRTHTRHQLRQAIRQQQRAHGKVRQGARAAVLQPVPAVAVAEVASAAAETDYEHYDYYFQNATAGLVLGTPICTMGAHGQFPRSAGACPNMVQPAAPGPAPIHAQYRYPANFVQEWKMYFIPDASDVPPYGDNNFLPRTPYNVTTGRSYYHTVDAAAGVYSMQETFDSFCVPLFFDLDSPLSYSNNYSCKQVNVGGIAYAILSDDRPQLAPECCIVGQPMYAPPPSWADGMAVKWNAMDGNVSVDWNASWDALDGVHAFGWDSTTSWPHALYNAGVPWLSNWIYMKYGELKEEVPPASVWEIPDSCKTATACLGSEESWVSLQ